MKLFILLLAVHQCLAADNIILKAVVATAVKLVDIFGDFILTTSPLPVLDQDVWWGEGETGVENTTISPYQIQFKSERINRLLSKLADRETFAPPLINSSFSYGTNSDYLNTFLDYWQNSYNFTARQERLNTYPQYITNIQGLDVHYYHIKPNTTKKVVPILFLHGWPCSNIENFYLFPELTKEREGYDFVFEIIGPSIPGYGYSQATSKIGFNTYQGAIFMKKFMSRLGFEKFYVFSGDVGLGIISDLATLYQDDILGLYTNMMFNISPKTGIKYVLGALAPTAVVEEQYADRIYPITDVIYYLLRWFGYFHMHASRPDSVGIALQDSPSAVASWQLSVLSLLTNKNYDYLEDGGLSTYEIDFLLDLLTVAWDSESLTTPTRLYAETLSVIQDPKILTIFLYPTNVPYSVIKFKNDIFYQPDNFLKDKYINIVHSTTLDYGGHYAAFEYPDVVQEDMWEAVQKMIEFNVANSRE